MGEFSLAHILIVAVVAMVLFGRGKVSSLMGEVGRGIASFKHGVREGMDEDPAALAAAADAPPEKPAQG